MASVQHANVKTACWLPYLTGYTNCTLLVKKLTQSYQLTMGVHVPIGATNRFLNGQKDIPIKERVRAIHIECPSHKADSVKRFLRLCSHQKKYPGGSKFRVMSEYWPYMSDENKERYRYMADKHKFFVDKMNKSNVM